MAGPKLFARLLYRSVAVSRKQMMPNSVAKIRGAKKALEWAAIYCEPIIPSCSKGELIDFRNSAHSRNPADMRG